MFQNWLNRHRLTFRLGLMSLVSVPA